MQRTGQVNPKATFKVSPVNEREARESGLWLKAWVADSHAGTVFAADPQEQALIVFLGLFLATGGSGRRRPEVSSFRWTRPTSALPKGHEGVEPLRPDRKGTLRVRPSANFRTTDDDVLAILEVARDLGQRLASEATA